MADSFSSMVEFKRNGQAISGFLAQPVNEGVYPGIILIHEWTGIVDHVKEVCMRLARQGYAVLAPGLFHGRIGRSVEQNMQLSESLDDAIALGDLGASLNYLQGLPFVIRDRIGCIGFCMGGRLAWRLLTMRQDLRAGVPFYGAAPPSADVPKIRAAVLAIYGELDERINATIPDLEKAVHGSGVHYEKVMYPGADHAFHNDTGVNYQPEAARDAWTRTLAHFAQHLK